MSGNRRYLLDTNALVALGEGNKKLLSMVECADYLATSVICKIEYLVGIAGNPVARKLFDAMLRVIDVIDVRNVDAFLIDDAVEIRTVRPSIKLPDAIIMASAKKTGCVLLTNDKQVLNAKLCALKSF